jgi:thioredoxin reductase
MQHYDVAVIGAGPAGLSAALILGRCTRRVLICDSGEPRNAASRALHGFITREGIPPLELRGLARAELGAYEHVELRDVRVDGIEPLKESGFELAMADGTRATARKILLTTGIVDTLPDLPGFRELYGRRVFHCPYCDGWEHRGQRIAVYGEGDPVKGLLRMLGLFSRDLWLCTDGARPDAGDLAWLERANVNLRSERVARLARTEKGVALEFSAGEPLEAGVLFFCAGRTQRCEFASLLGCRFDDTGLVQKDELGHTGVPGVFVAGDAARSVMLAVVAAGEGAEAAFAINRELLHEEFGE